MTAGTERSNQSFAEQALVGTRFERVRWVAETGSTNQDLAEAARKGAPEQVLVTDLQTAGRGRRGRTWRAPSGSGVLMSLLIRDVVVDDGFWAVGAVALAAAQVVDDLIEDECVLKWPNDVVVVTKQGVERKVAGVLAEIVEGAVVVGIGINANWPISVPEEMAERGTAINYHLDGTGHVDRSRLAVDIVLSAAHNLALDRAELRAAWSRRCATLGHPVRLELSQGVVEGVAVGIEDSGALVLEVDGETATYHVGDVVHLRR